MARLETYTASGQTRGGPVAAGTPASALTAPYEALQNVGGAIQQNAAVMADIAQQRQKENDFRWINDASTQFKDELIKWERDPANQGSEDVGEKYRAFADERVGEYIKNAPNSRAGDLFKRSIMPSVQADWERNLKIGEATRFQNFQLSQTNGSIVDNDAYRLRATTDPTTAQTILENSLTQRLASIDVAYGRQMPANAAKMKENAVINAVDGVMDTNPALARKLLDKHGVVDPETRQIMLNRIETAERNANATAHFNEVKLIENSIKLGYEKLQPVPMPSDAVLKTFPPGLRAQKVHEVNVANTTIAAYSTVKSWNWAEQQKAIQGIDIAGDPVKGDAKKNLFKLVEKSKKQQTEDPAGWQLVNDSEFAGMDRRINALPPAQRPAARMAELQRMKSLQGYAPTGTSDEQAKRYLHLPTGLHNVLSVDDAKTRAATFNNIPPNQLTQAVQDFESEFPDPELAAMAWNDMQNLPEGHGKLKMGIRIAGAINDPAVRNNFLGAVSNKEGIRTDDKATEFYNELAGRKGNDAYNRFVAGWRGDGNQRGQEMEEFEDSIVAYSRYLSATEKLDTSKAVDLAVKRIITDNYGILSINGTDVPVNKFPKDKAYTDQDMTDLEVGITDLLRTMGPQAISTELRHFPLQPRLPDDPDKVDKYLKSAILPSSTVVVEADGNSASIYLKGDGANDFRFQARDKQGDPLLFQFGDAIIRGRKIREKQMQDIRLGVDPEEQKAIQQRVY